MNRNRLDREASLYLRQHGLNPIDWYPWGEEAFEKARGEDRPIFLSIGYSSCHWCHEMEREVFDVDEVASYMNDRFVCIKVDREERPDVDALYMDAVVALTGSGGWPLSVFLTPDLEPFHGGTYYPRRAFLLLARAVHEAWIHRRGAVKGIASRLGATVAREIDTGSAPAVDREVLAAAAFEALASFDHRWGGIGIGMKFPMPVAWTFLLHVAGGGDPRLVRAVRATLEAMASGGLHDHLCGGFHRYAVDRAWVVPHFEKMLYDNALLASLYAEASVILDEPRFAAVARSTMDFMVGEMAAAGGGFGSSLDADSPGGEGAFYTWTPAEIVDVCGPVDGPALAGLLGVAADGPLDGRSTLTLRESPGEASLLLDRWRPALLARRSRRPPPGLDPKVVTAWNGLALSALARGHAVLGDPRYLEAAERAASFLWTSHRSPGGDLVRASTHGRPAGVAILDDYAMLAAGLLDLHLATGEPTHLERALDLADRVLAGFAHPRAGFYLSMSGPRASPARQVAVEDGALPSGNAVMLQFLVTASAVTGRHDLRAAWERMLEAYSGLLRRAGIGMAGWLDGAARALALPPAPRSCTPEGCAAGPGDPDARRDLLIGGRMR